MFICKESDTSYIIAESINNRAHSIRITSNNSYKEWDLDQCAQYYLTYENKRFTCFKDEIDDTIYYQKLSQYHNSFSSLNNELTSLLQWFTIYDQQVQQYSRALRLNLPYDAKYGTIEELDAQAVINSQRISELRKEIAELEKTKPVRPQ